MVKDSRTSFCGIKTSRFGISMSLLECSRKSRIYLAPLKMKSSHSWRNRSRSSDNTGLWTVSLWSQYNSMCASVILFSVINLNGILIILTIHLKILLRVFVVIWGCHLNSCNQLLIRFESKSMNIRGKLIRRGVVDTSILMRLVSLHLEVGLIQRLAIKEVSHQCAEDHTNI